MGEGFSLTETLTQEKFQFGCVDLTANPEEPFGMAKKGAKTVEPRLKRHPRHPTFIRQWRKFRGLTQTRLADRIGMSNGNLSEIENGNTAYTQETLEVLADALQCTPADLLMRDPTDPEGIWSLWDQAKPAERLRIIEVVKAMIRTSAA
jgi:transcriptional regulator with XRE-family HTH domain